MQNYVNVREASRRLVPFYLCNLIYSARIVSSFFVRGPLRGNTDGASSGIVNDDAAASVGADDDHPFLEMVRAYDASDCAWAMTPFSDDALCALATANVSRLTVSAIPHWRYSSGGSASSFLNCRIAPQYVELSDMGYRAPWTEVTRDVSP